MVRYTDLNDVAVDGVASSSFQGQFLGMATQMPAPSQEYENRLLLYGGSSSQFVKYAWYTCRMSPDGTWSWVRQDLAPPYALTPLMAVQSDADGEVASSDVSATELSRLRGVRSSVQEQIDTKEDVIKGAVVTMTTAKATPQRVIVSNAQGNLIVSNVTSAELSALHGLSSPIQEQLDGKVDDVTEVNGHPLTGNIELTAEDVGAMPVGTAIPTKTSELVNDSGFLTEDTSSLSNYYLKSETYSRSEVDSLVATGLQGQYKPVTGELPTSGEPGYIYIKPSADDPNHCEQYVWTDDGWVFIGTTDVEPHVEWTDGGLQINGTLVPFATDTQNGMMSKDQAMMLDLAVRSVTPVVEHGYVYADVVLNDGQTIRSTGAPLPGAVVQTLERVGVADWVDVAIFKDGVWEVFEDLDVSVFTAGAFGETNMMCSTIHILAGSYRPVEGHDMVFSNAESNTRVGVRVLMRADGTISVYDCNGLPLETLGSLQDVTSDESHYALSALRLVEG